MPSLRSGFICGVLPAEVYLGLAVWTPNHNPPADTLVEESVNESGIKLQEVSPQQFSTASRPTLKMTPSASPLMLLLLGLSSSSGGKKMRTKSSQIPSTSLPGFWPPTTPLMRSYWKKTCWFPVPEKLWYGFSRTACEKTLQVGKNSLHCEQ